MARLLTVEDDPRIRASIVEAFTEEGHECDEASDLSTARDQLASARYDLVLLNVMLPDGDGWDLLREMRERADPTRVIFLSAKHEVAERLHGLSLGAVDYVVKPFDLRELEARVEVALRRVVTSELPECFGLRMDPVRRRAFLREQLLDLTPKEFEFLAILLRAKGEPVEREALIREVWDLPYTDNDNVLDVLVTRLRRKLRATRGPTIYTQRGVGYGLSEKGGVVKRWSLARHSALWFGGLLLSLLLTLVGSAYFLISNHVSSELDAEVEELGIAASSQLVGAGPEQARAVLEVLIREGHDLGMGFVWKREEGDVLCGRPELALERPADVEPESWRRASIPMEDGSTLLIGIDGIHRSDDLDGLTAALAVLAALFAGIAALSGWLFGRRMSSLLAEVSGAVDPTGAPTPRGAPREISQLVDSINAGFTRAEEMQSRSKLLIAGAAHALRSPIQALLSQAQSTLRKQREPERYRETLEGQEHELTEFARSVDNLVALCAEGGGTVVSESFDLMAELRLRLIPDVERARRSEVELVLDGPESLLVEAERESLVLAVRNLVSNAISVSRAGQRVDVRVDARDDLVRVTVDDQGPGVPEDDRERVFEPMRRGSNTSSEPTGRVRYGLGLALVRRAMDDHAGKAWIESAPGGGARACVEFGTVRE